MMMGGWVCSVSWSWSVCCRWRRSGCEGQWMGRRAGGHDDDRVLRVQRGDWRHADEQQQHERLRETRRVQRYTAQRQHANVTWERLCLLKCDPWPLCRRSWAIRWAEAERISEGADRCCRQGPEHHHLRSHRCVKTPFNENFPKCILLILLSLIQPLMS